MAVGPTVFGSRSSLPAAGRRKGQARLRAAGSRFPGRAGPPREVELLPGVLHRIRAVGIERGSRLVEMPDFSAMALIWSRFARYRPQHQIVQIAALALVREQGRFDLSARIFSRLRNISGSQTSKRSDYLSHILKVLSPTYVTFRCTTKYKTENRVPTYIQSA